MQVGRCAVERHVHLHLHLPLPCGWVREAPTLGVLKLLCDSCLW
jgi:hypothetical protein